MTSRKKLEADLSEAREQGYAVTVEEYEVGLNALSAPVRSEDGEVVAALSASGPAFRLTDERLRELAPLLVAGADELSRRLGYAGRGPGGPARSLTRTEPSRQVAVRDPDTGSPTAASCCPCQPVHSTAASSSQSVRWPAKDERTSTQNPALGSSRATRTAWVRPRFV